MLRLGVIGYRGHAANVVKLITKSSIAEIQFIFHPQKKLDFPNATNRIEDLLKCDAVLILSPNHTHFEYLKYFSQNYSGYIFCEKPPVNSESELRQLKLDHTKTFFNFNYRFSRLMRLIDASRKDGCLGDVVSITAISTHGLAFKEQYLVSWRSDANKHKSGVVETLGIHFVDLCALILGQIQTSKVSGRVVSGRGDATDSASISLEFNHASAHIFVSYAAPFFEEITVIGTNGIIRWSCGRLTIRSPRSTYNSEGRFIEPPLVTEEVYPGSSIGGESLIHSIHYFLTCCRDRVSFPSELFEQSMRSNEWLIDAKGLL